MMLRIFAASEDSDQPEHLRSWMGIFTLRLLYSTDAQANFSLLWAHISDGTISHVAIHFIVLYEYPAGPKFDQEGSISPAT